MDNLASFKTQNCRGEISFGVIALFGISFLLAIWLRVKLDTAVSILMFGIIGLIFAYMKVSDIILRRKLREREEGKGIPTNNLARRRSRKTHGKNGKAGSENK